MLFCGRVTLNGSIYGTISLVLRPTQGPSSTKIKEPARRNVVLASVTSDPPGKSSNLDTLHNMCMWPPTNMGH